MTSTDIDTKPAAELTPEEEADLAARATADVDAGVVLPLLKLTQQLSREVTDDDLPSGHFVNSLTGADYGESVELIVVYGYKGRFFTKKGDPNTYIADGEVAPDNWPEEYAGQRFADIPDAEESYKERVNADEDAKWGSGPPIQTTHNFIGFVPDEERIVPVRLSLKSKGAKAGQKIGQITKLALHAPWHNVISLGRSAETDAQDRPYYVVNARRGRETTPEERQAGIAMFREVEAARGRFKLVGDTDEDAEARDAKRKVVGESDGLEVI